MGALKIVLMLLLVMSLGRPAVAAAPKAPPADEGATWLSTPRTQENELFHHQQLQLHQGLALTTLGVMTFSAGLGLYTSNVAAPEQRKMLRNAHMALGGITGGLYLSAASLALSAPRGYDLGEEGSIDSVAIHRYMAWLHGLGMASTVILGVMAATAVPVDPVLHGVVGGTTLGLMGVSAGVIALDF